MWAKVKVRYAMTRLIKKRYTKLARTADIRMVIQVRMILANIGTTLFECKTHKAARNWIVPLL
jgi:hypothetical protein